MTNVVPIRRPGRAAWRNAIDESPMGTITEHLPRFVAHLKAKPAAPRTIERYVDAAVLLSTFLGDPDISAITRDDLERWVSHRLESCGGSTVYGNFVSIKQLFKFLEVEVPEFTDLAADMKPPRFEEREIQVPPRDLIEGMVRQTQTQRDELGNRPFEAIRDEVILRMFIETGARLSEITDLTLADNLGDAIRVLGKSKGAGVKVERLLAISGRTQTALRKYLRARARHPHAHSDAMFLGHKGRMTPSGVRQMVWRRSSRLGQRIHPHQFRHALAHAWQATPGQKEGDLQEIMGWRSPTMLRRYGGSVRRERAHTAHRAWLEREP